MAFYAWLCLHALFLLAQHVAVPMTVRANYHRTVPCATRLTSLLWYAAPLSWLWSRPAFSLLMLPAGLLVYLCCAALVISAMRANPFFVPVLRRPVWIVSGGPYRWLRHPGYVGFVGMGFGSCLFLNHPYGLLPLSLYALLLARRAAQENRLLYS